MNKRPALACRTARHTPRLLSIRRCPKCGMEKPIPMRYEIVHDRSIQVVRMRIPRPRLPSLPPTAAVTPPSLGLTTMAKSHPPS